MAKVSEETQKALDGLKTEVTAGMRLTAVTELDHAWNGAHNRILGILKKYREGQGLLQGGS